MKIVILLLTCISCFGAANIGVNFDTGTREIKPDNLKFLFATEHSTNLISLQSRTARIVDVDDFNTVQAAIDRVQSLPSNQVKLLRFTSTNTYTAPEAGFVFSNLHNTIIDTRGATFVQDPAVTNYIHRLFYAVASTGLVVNAQGSTFTGLRAGTNFLGSYTENGHVLEVRNAQDIWIYGGVYEDASADGGYFGGSLGISNVVVRGATFKNSYRNNASVINGSDITFDSCTFYGANGTSPQAGIDWEPNSGNTISRGRLINCLVFGNTGNGVYVNRGAGTSIEDMQFANNRYWSNSGAGLLVARTTNFTDTASKSFNNQRGVQIDRSAKVTLNDFEAAFNTIDGLLAEGVNGLQVSGGDYSSNTTTGIRIKGTGTTYTHAPTVAGVRLVSNLEYGIYAENSKGVNLSDNYLLYNGFHGIFVSGTSRAQLDANHVIGSGAVLNNTYAGIFVNGESNRISNNHILKGLAYQSGTASAGDTNTITLSTNASTLTDFYVNLFVNVTSGTGSGQDLRQISAYNGTTKVATVSTNFTVTPDNTSVYELVPANRPAYALRIAGHGNRLGWNALNGGTIHESSATGLERIDFDNLPLWATDAEVAAGYQPLNSQLTVFGAFASDGIIVRSNGVFFGRQVATTDASELAITNPSGQGGNPTFTIQPTIARVADVDADLALKQDLDADLTLISTNTPGNNYFFGTDGGGNKGFYLQSSLAGVVFTTGDQSIAGNKTFTGAMLQPTDVISAEDIDWSTGNMFSKTTAGNIVFTFSNATAGQWITVAVTAGGSHTVTWPTVTWKDASTPTQTASKMDIYTFFYNGTTFYGSASQNY